MPWQAATWTDERKQLVRNLWAQGFTATEVARQVGGVSRNAIIGLCHRNQFRQGKRRAAPMPKPEPLPRLPDYVPVDPPIPSPLPPLPPSPDFLGLPLWQLTDSQCRWPHGDGPFVFCGQPRERGGTAYCAEHRRRGHAPGHHR
jgi:GcrA cell cycle regulator